MAGRSALWFWVPPCCFPPPPCGFLALITNLEQFQGQNTPLRESSYCFCEPTLFSVLLLHCFESQSNGLFLTSKRVFRFVCRSVSYYSVLKIYLARFTSRRKRNTLKGFVIRSSWKKQFVQQWEMPKRVMSAGKRADRSFSFSSKMQEWNSFTALFPICRKDSRTAMSDSPHGPRSSKHAGRKYHLQWRGWNRISCDYKLMLTLMSEASGLMIRCSDWLSKLIQTKIYAALLN